jgi:hypothetical protein
MRAARLIINGFTSRLRMFHLYGFVTMISEELHNLGLCSALRAFLYRTTPAVKRGFVFFFFGIIQRTTPFGRLMRHTSGCAGRILILIIMGPHLVASYDTQGGVDDLL